MHISSIIDIRLFRSVKAFFLLMVSLLATNLSAADDLTVKAYLDKSAVPLNQQFTLSIEITGEKAQSAQPEVPVLDPFAVFLGSGSSQNIQVVNGKMTVSRTISYYYQAAKLGDFTIGAIKVKSGDKTYETKPVPVKIVKAEARPRESGQTSSQGGVNISAEDLYLSVTANKRTVYHNEPIVLTYKIYTRVNVSSFEYNVMPETAGFWVEEYPLNNQPQTATEVIDGKRFTTAVLKKMALFPMSPGRKTIDPMKLTCNITVRNRSRDIFDDFFNSGFGRTVKKPIESKPVTVTVKPLPEEGKPAGFAGVVGRYRITSRVDKQSVKTNEAVTYKVIVSGTGNIKTIPEPEVTFPGDFEVYPPEISEKIDRRGNTISGSRTFEWVVIPRATGTPVIKSIELPIFDPYDKKYKVLKTNPIILTVAKGKESDLSAPTGLSKEEVRLLGQDIRFIKTEMPAFIDLRKTSTAGSLIWIAAVLPLLGLATAISYNKFRGRLETDIAFARNRQAGKAARKRLSTAASLMKHQEQKAFYAEAGRSIMGFLGDKLNIPSASIMTDEVRKLLKERQVSETAIKGVVSCLDTCDRQRFAPAALNREEMENFYKKCSEAINSIDREIS